MIYEQLQLTYRPEEPLPEGTDFSSDEPEQLPSDFQAVSDVETAIPPPPPPPPPAPQSSLATGDLLVDCHYYEVLCSAFCSLLLMLLLLWVQGLDFTTGDASAIEESNALALAIVPSETGKHFLFFICLFCLHFSNIASMISDFHGFLYCFSLKFANAAPTFNVQAKDFDPSGWELALVTTPSSNISSANDRQLVGPSYALYFCFILYSLVHCHFTKK